MWSKLIVIYQISNGIYAGTFIKIKHQVWQTIGIEAKGSSIGYATNTMSDNKFIFTTGIAGSLGNINIAFQCQVVRDLKGTVQAKLIGINNPVISDGNQLRNKVGHRHSSEDSPLWIHFCGCAFKYSITPAGCPTDHVIGLGIPIGRRIQTRKQAV